MKTANEVIRAVDNMLIVIEVVSDKIDSLHGYGFTREFFDNDVYKEHCSGYYDIARDHYNILGDEILLLGNAIKELREYIKELQDDKDKSELQ